MKPLNLPLIGLTVVNVIAAGIAVTAVSNNRAEATPKSSVTLRAERLELIDSKGQLRGQLFVEDSGEVVFRLRDEKGQIRVKLGASERGSGFILMDDQTEPGVQMLSGVSALTKTRDTKVTLRDGSASRTLTPRDLAQ